MNRSFYQGFFMAPVVTAAALKGAIFAANLYERLGFPVLPDGRDERHDIIQAITLGSPEGVGRILQRDTERGSGGFICDPGSLGHARV